MSSADLAHILTLWSNSFRLVCFTLFLPKKKQVEHLLFCLFPSFKERVMLPFEASVRIVFQSVTVVIAVLCSFLECKDSNFFLLSKFIREKRLFSFFRFSSLTTFGLVGLQRYGGFFRLSK